MLIGVGNNIINFFLKHQILENLTCYRAQYLVSRYDQMVRAAYRLLHILQGPIASYNQTKIALPIDL
jgi:hypothetical protein